VVGEAGQRRVPDTPYRPTMPEVVRRASSLFGDSQYIVMPDRQISFRQLEAGSRRLAKELLAAGVTKGTPIGIHLVTGPEWVMVFAAVTRIGAVAMPFSTIYRPAELRNAMRVGDVSILITSPKMLGKDHETFLEDAIPGLVGTRPGRFSLADLPYLRSVQLLGESDRPWAETLRLSTDDAEQAVGGVDSPLLEAVEGEVSPADSIVTVFTSGTTAAPKAVVHSHGAAIRKTAPTANAGLSAIFPGRHLSMMPFFWIGGIQQVLSALQSGSTLLTLERLDAAAALQLGAREKATSIMGNPQALRSLLGGRDIESAIPTIRPLPHRDWEGGPSSKGDMATGLGMTETFGPWAGVEGFDFRVVDPDRGEVLDGEGASGEFHVRGYGLMQSLYKLEREEVLEPDGFYATGDLGYVEQGLVYFKARVKDLIKTKGANVAPPEVEEVLNARPEVQIAFVIGLPHPEWGEEVVAGVVPRGNETVDVRALLDDCRRLLSPYKVPTTVEILRPEEVPYLSSSKPDRRALREILAERRASRRA
jgi:acyl-CoA synthetase (AMP-forming)/AMP-acid ligase II